MEPKRRLESRRVGERHQLKAEAHLSKTVVWGYPGTIHAPPALKQFQGRKMTVLQTYFLVQNGETALKGYFPFLSKVHWCFQKSSSSYLFGWTYLLNTIRIYQVFYSAWSSFWGEFMTETTAQSNFSLGLYAFWVKQSLTRAQMQVPSLLLDLSSPFQLSTAEETRSSVQAFGALLSPRDSICRRANGKSCLSRS